MVSTIDDLDEERGSGFIFHEYTPESLVEKLKEALQCFHDEECWLQMVNVGMTRDFTWKESAEEYGQLYRQLLEK